MTAAAMKPRTTATIFAETTAKALGGNLGSLGTMNPFATQSKLGSLDLATLLALDGLQVGNYDDGRFVSFSP